MPTLLVLAAGMGSRYGGLKQVDPVGPGGHPLMDYSIYDALRAGFDRLVYVIRRDFAETFQAQIAARYQGRIAIDYAYQALDSFTGSFTIPSERQKPWGTGHAILVAADVVKEPFAVINADDYYGPQSFAAMVRCLSDPAACNPARYAMVGYRLRNTLSAHGHVSRGICEVDAENRLIHVTEHTQIEMHGTGGRSVASDGTVTEFSGDEFASMNFWGFHPTLFEHLKSQFAEFLAERGQDLKAEFYIPSAIDRLIREGRVETRVLPTDDAWFGITYREDREAVAASIRALVDRGVYPERLFE